MLAGPWTKDQMNFVNMLSAAIHKKSIHEPQLHTA
jgi:hypothetical protein